MDLSREVLSKKGKQKFGIFRAHFREFSIYFHEIFMVASSYRVLAADIERLLISSLQWNLSKTDTLERGHSLEGGQRLCPNFLIFRSSSVKSNLFKVNTFIKRTLFLGPKGGRFRDSTAISLVTRLKFWSFLYEILHFSSCPFLQAFDLGE